MKKAEVSITISDITIGDMRNTTRLGICYEYGGLLRHEMKEVELIKAKCLESFKMALIKNMDSLIEWREEGNRLTAILKVVIPNSDDEIPLIYDFG